jgi:hypothetical protein
MPKFTDEMKGTIRQEFRKTPVYKTVAEKLDIDERTVKRVIDEARERSDEEPAAGGIYVSKDISAADHSVTPVSFPASSSSYNSARQDLIKTIYLEFEAGSGPNKVLAKYGYEPDLVLKEWENYNKMRSSDVASIQRILLKKYDAESSSELRLYANLYKQNGYLTHTAHANLLSRIIASESKSMLGHLLSDSKSMLPKGVRHILCGGCGKVLGLLRDTPYEGGLLCSSCCMRTARLAGVDVKSLRILEGAGSMNRMDGS